MPRCISGCLLNTEIMEEHFPRLLGEAIHSSPGRRYEVKWEQKEKKPSKWSMEWRKYKRTELKAPHAQS